MPYTGGCQCGQLTYAIDADPVVAYCCHCLDCQKQSSSAFGMSVWFPADRFTVTAGELAVFVTRGSSGSPKTCAFCATCGSRIYNVAIDEPDMLSMKGGTLDDINGFRPVAHIWTRSAQPWVLSLLDPTMCYAQEPESFDDLIDRFTAPTKGA
ncbi:GFA family protein [Gymnodinialimonas sp.]